MLIGIAGLNACFFTGQFFAMSPHGTTSAPRHGARDSPAAVLCGLDCGSRHGKSPRLCLANLASLFEWAGKTWLAMPCGTPSGLPDIETFHLLALAVLLGTVLIVNLRVFGLGRRSVPPLQMARQLEPWMLVSLGGLIASGIPHGVFRAGQMFRERRGHAFCRYADDCNVYVRSRRAGERVMALLRRLYGRLHLTVNEAKSAVASVFGRKFLGYAFWVGPGRVVKRKVADKAIKAFKTRIRALTPRQTGRSLGAVTERLRSFMPGWKAYFRLAQTPDVWRRLDQWVRHRLRAIQLKQWGRSRTIFRELTALGARPELAIQVAASGRRWWHSSGKLLNSVLTIDWADRLGAPRLA